MIGHQPLRIGSAVSVLIISWGNTGRKFWSHTSTWRTLEAGAIPARVATSDKPTCESPKGWVYLALNSFKLQAKGRLRRSLTFYFGLSFSLDFVVPDERAELSRSTFNLAGRCCLRRAGSETAVQKQCKPCRALPRQVTHPPRIGLGVALKLKISSLHLTSQGSLRCPLILKGSVEPGVHQHNLRILVLNVPIKIEVVVIGILQIRECPVVPLTWVPNKLRF